MTLCNLFFLLSMSDHLSAKNHAPGKEGAKAGTDSCQAEFQLPSFPRTRMFFQEMLFVNYLY